MSKGDLFEQEVFEQLKKEVGEGNMGVSSNAVIKRKVPYYSEARKSNIIVDISIEVSRKDVGIPFLYWIWECKNYDKKIEVDDVEEFHAKLEQIGSDKTKGTLITTVGFQKATFEYAKSKGIGLMLMTQQGTLQAILESIDDNRVTRHSLLDSISTRELIHEAITDSFNSGLFLQTTTGKITKSIENLFKLEMESAVKDERIVLFSESIRDVIGNRLKQLSAEIEDISVYDIQTCNIDVVANQLYERYKLTAPKVNCKAIKVSYKDIPVMFTNHGYQQKGKGIEFTLHIPVEGDTNLLMFNSEDHISQGTYLAEISWQTIVMRWVHKTLDKTSLQNNLNNLTRHIEHQLPYLQYEVNAFNNSLLNNIKEKINKRRQTLDKAKEILNELGILKPNLDPS